MKAMILAAGKGTRMRPLTNNTPKPLLPVGGQPLIFHHLEKLAHAGFKEIVINVSYLGEQIIETLGGGQRWGLTLDYSNETKPLETAGGILHAQNLLGNKPFALINGDVWSDYPLNQLRDLTLTNNALAHLILVKNPEHNPSGDFAITPLGKLTHKHSTSSHGSKNYTFSGISLIDPKLIQDYPQKREAFPLGEVFRAGIDKQQLSAELYDGEWVDVGTVERLNQLNQRFSGLT